MAKVHTIAAQLKSLGIPVLRVEEEDEDADAEIAVTERISIQVGRGYLIANLICGEGASWCMHHAASRKTAALVAADVQAFLARVAAEVAA